MAMFEHNSMIDTALAGSTTKESSRDCSALTHLLTFSIVERL